MTGTEILNSFLSHGETYRVLFHQFENRSAVHAYLITGEKGTGKKTLAKLMGAALLCTSETSKPCGNCKNCLLSETGEHPDMILIEKGNPIAPGIKKGRTTIPVEDIREMIRLCGIRSPEGNMHVVLIFDADTMTVQAQNCLLKTLEDPPSGTCIILVTDHPETLLTTIISRCRPVRTIAWPDEYIQQVLSGNGVSSERAKNAISAANGSIGRALELSSDDQYWELREEILDAFFKTSSRSDVLRISTSWKDRKQEADQIFSILDHFVRVLTEARFGNYSKVDRSIFPKQWQSFSESAEPERFLELAEAVTNARKQLQFSVNFQAVMEQLIFIFIGEGNAWLK